MTTRGKETMTSEMISNLYVFVLAGFVGFEVIRRVSPLLHTPLMALTNALDAIVVVAAIIIAGRRGTPLSTFLGAVAVAAAFSNMVGGFLITDRMVRMFKLSGRGKQS
jgi:NAD(P) transhydrogenase subunit alpha